jgi:hypothetical protein
VTISGVEFALFKSLIKRQNTLDEPVLFILHLNEMIKKLIKNTALLLLVAVNFSSLIGCTFSRQCISSLRSTDDFIPQRDDNRVLFELGAEEYANRVVSFLPSAIQTVEEIQYRSFTKPVRVYVCRSIESFTKMYGANVRAGVLTKLFLSPRVFEDGDEIAKMYLIHELSHLHILDQLGNYKMNELPVWFKEGLATYVSNGGGAQTVTEKQAIESIKSGKYLVPDETGGFIFQKYPGDWELTHHMFYRQSMMFINYLAATNPSGFRNLLLDIEDGEGFAKALKASYNKELEELFDEFLHNINRTG